LACFFLWLSDNNKQRHGGNSLLIIGIGETGSKITLDVIKEINSEYLLLNTKKNSKYIAKNIIIDTKSWINPPIYKIREAFLQDLDDIYSIINNYAKIIIIGNLASKLGIAIIPLLANILYKNGEKEIFSFVIMPFGFEKCKIFHSGVSLSFVSTYSNSTIIVDNNSFLKNNPELSFLECFRITNNAIRDIIISSYGRGFPGDFNIIATCKESGNIEEVFSNSLSMSNNSEIKTVEKTFMYIYPAKEKIDKIDSIIKTFERITNESDNEINIISNTDKLAKIHLMIKTNNSLFSSYDPLNQFIPIKNFLDFEPETNQDIQEISYLRNIEAKTIQ
jgi:cell division protein FtsZ